MTKTTLTAAIAITLIMPTLATCSKDPVATKSFEAMSSAAAAVDYWISQGRVMAAALASNQAEFTDLLRRSSVLPADQPGEAYSAAFNASNGVMAITIRGMTTESCRALVENVKPAKPAKVHGAYPLSVFDSCSRKNQFATGTPPGVTVTFCIPSAVVACPGPGGVVRM